MKTSQRGMNMEIAFQEFMLPNGRVIGRKVNEILFLERDSRKHFYIKGGGYPANNDMLKECKSLGVQFVKVIEHTANNKINVYTCSLDKYLNAVLIKEPNFEAQRCVPLKEMIKDVHFQY